MRDVIITPHAAGASDLAAERWRTLTAENVRRYVAGEPLLSLVDVRAGY
jgi:phosphoglycerate dehydrogenase-like enzyme